MILDSGIYMYFGAVVTTIAKTGIAADDDFVQIDAVGGTGDITAVTTGNNSGLDGGSNSGDVDLELDLANLSSEATYHQADNFAFYDSSASATKRIGAQNFATHIAGAGLVSTTDAKIKIELRQLPLETTVEGDDTFAIVDATDDSNSRVELDQIIDDMGLATDAEVTSGALQPADIVGSATVTVVRTTDGVTLSASDGGGGGGLSAVSSDATLDGSGTTADPLGVADEGVDTDQLADDAVSNAKLAANSVHSAQINTGAVGTSDLEDDAVTITKIADSAVGHDQLASNSVREPEIQANAVTHAKMADDSVDTLELQDGAVTVAKMDSGTATDGQVATADGSGGVAYETVTGGGGGTDDQTAAEVPVTATGFAGNLSGTDTDVQTALDTIDGFTLGGGGVSTFIALTDTPAAITADECVQGNAAGDALVFAACATGGGGTTVTANPGSGATDLTTVTIGTTDYTIAPRQPP